LGYGLDVVGVSKGMPLRKLPQQNAQEVEIQTQETQLSPKMVLLSVLRRAYNICEMTESAGAYFVKISTFATTRQRRH